MTKRILCGLMVFSVLISFAACADTALKDSAQTADSVTTEEVETKIEFPHSPQDFEQYEFCVLVDRENVNLLDIVDFDITEEVGEVLNDAVYRRNLVVSEKFNIKFSSYHSDNITSDITKTVMAGTDDYDAFMPRLMNAATAVTKGYAHELTGLSYLSLDMPWWDINATRDLSIDHKQYVLAGDIFYKHYDGTPMMLFNKILLENMNLENPYTLVENNEWTLEKFNQMASQAKSDLNGDGKFDLDDQYGLSTQADYLTSMLNGCGVKFVDKDGEDLPYSSVNTPKTVTVLDMILDHYINSTWCLHRDAGAPSLSQFWIFPKGHSLFYWSLARYINLGLRDMEDEFGILPIPKYDAQQPRYYHTLNNWHSYTYVLPVSASDIERSAYISDALAYYGREYILPAYYENCLTRKYVRDEESSAMLDIIFTSTVYDLGTVYNIGGFVGQLEQQIQKNKFTFASTYEKQLPKIEQDLEKLISIFNELK